MRDGLFHWDFAPPCCEAPHVPLRAVLFLRRTHLHDAQALGYRVSVSDAAIVVFASRFLRKHVQRRVVI
jgi:predicted membrane-bound mannosyltransferase